MPVVVYNCTIGCFLPLEASVASCGAVKPSPQGEVFQNKSSSGPRDAWEKTGSGVLEAMCICVIKGKDVL